MHTQSNLKSKFFYQANYMTVTPFRKDMILQWFSGIFCSFLATKDDINFVTEISLIFSRFFGCVWVHCMQNWILRSLSYRLSQSPLRETALSIASNAKTSSFWLRLVRVTFQVLLLFIIQVFLFFPRNGISFLIKRGVVLVYSRRLRSTRIQLNCLKFLRTKRTQNHYHIKILKDSSLLLRCTVDQKLEKKN